MEESTLDDVWSDMFCRSASDIQKIRRYRGNGYKGHSMPFGEQGTVISAHRVRVDKRTGDRFRDVVLIGSGGMAEVVVAAMAGRDLRGITVTRLDVQATVKSIGEPKPELGRYIYDAITDGELDVGRRVTEFHQSPTGQTVYVGKRVSKSVFYRIYDKGGQLGGERGKRWRFEAEFGKRRAQSAYKMLYPVTGGVAVSSLDMVRSMFCEIGIDILDGRDGVIVGQPEIAELEQDRSRRLSWLSRCVSPVVGLLLAEDEERAYEVYEALNIQDRIYEFDKLTGRGTL